MATTFNKIYRKVANNGNSNDYQLVSMIGSDGVPVDIMKGATTNSDGVGGLMPTPSSATVGLLTNRGDYDTGDLLQLKMDNTSRDNLKLYMLDDKSDTILIPSITQAVANGNTTGLMTDETAVELAKLPNGYTLNYDRAKLVYHSWNPSKNGGYNENGEWNIMQWETDYDGTSIWIGRYDLKKNTSSQSNPWIYPIFDMPDVTTRSRSYNIMNNGVSVQPFHMEKGDKQWADYQDGKNYYTDVYKMVFDVPGLYAVYSRFWVRSTGTTMKRVSLCPYINGVNAARYRGSYLSFQNYSKFYTNVFFHYFDKNDSLYFGVFPEDTVSDTSYVTLAFSDVAVYIINWDGQLSLTKS